ncbi:MAG: DUF4157 domain-containing protein [Ignavibacteria bacterium]|nr:DUF4157 domain-containing protein [Ignavibacteria bacterium]
MSVLKTIKVLVVSTLFLAVNLFAQYEFTLQEGTVIVPVSGDTAKGLLMTEDEYTNTLSKFDLMSKTLKENEGVTKLNYLNDASLSAMEWTKEEIIVLGKVVAETRRCIDSLGLKLKMPARIEVIKSTMNNEGGADGYTRGNYMVLKQSRVGAYSESYLALFAHELFHIISRFDQSMSEKVYGTIGFIKCNEVVYPSEIADLRISNPDAPFNNYYVTVEYKGKPVDAMLVLFASKPYEGGSFFFYMQTGLMFVEGSADDKKPVYADGKPVIVPIKDVTGFYEKTGKNTPYNIHAEEICADHFEMLLTGAEAIPNPELIEAMRNIMTAN